MQFADMKGQKIRNQFPALYDMLESVGEGEIVEPSPNDNGQRGYYGFMMQLFIMGRNGKGMQSYSAVNGDFCQQIGVVLPDDRRAEIWRLWVRYGLNSGLSERIATHYRVSLRTVQMDIKHAIEQTVQDYLELDIEIEGRTAKVKQRRAKVYQHIAENGFDRNLTQRLANSFGISERTIRRDIEMLKQDAVDHAIASGVLEPV